MNAKWFLASVLLMGLVVHHGSLGRSVPPMTRQALVLQLEERPLQVYVISPVNQ